MAHNPIIKVSRIDAGNNIEIKLNTQLVLYRNNVIHRILKPGENLSFFERLKGGLMGYLIDTGPHNASWSYNAPTRDEMDTFPITVNLKYRVIDCKRMVEDDIQDTETRIARSLETHVRKETRAYRLHQHRKVEARLEDLLTHSLFEGLGLELMEKDVSMNFSEQDYERIRKLENLERAMTITQQTEHDTDLPSKDPAYKFQAHVIVNYRVKSEERMPTSDLAEAERWLWKKVRARLRRVSRDHSILEVNQAETALQNAFEDDLLEDHGIEIVSGEIEIEIDERVKKRAEEMESVRSTLDIEGIQAELEDMREKRDLDKQKRAIDFYTPYIETGQWRLLALSLSRNEMDAQQILNYLDDRQKGNLAHELEILTKLHDMKILDDVDEARAARMLSVISLHSLPKQIPLMNEEMLLEGSKSKGKLEENEKKSSKTTPKSEVDAKNDEGIKGDEDEPWPGEDPDESIIDGEMGKDDENNPDKGEEVPG
jgi:hypothetical protein